MKHLRKGFIERGRCPGCLEETISVYNVFHRTREERMDLRTGELGTEFIFRLVGLYPHVRCVQEIQKTRRYNAQFGFRNSPKQERM